MSTNNIYGLAAPLLPNMLDENQVPAFWFGLIFSIYAIAQLVVSPFIGVIIDKVGTTKLVPLGLVLMGTSSVLTGYTESIENKFSLIYSVLLLRFMHGTASAIINTSCWISAVKNPSKAEFMIGLLEAVAGFGLCTGRMGGSYFYTILGF